MNRGFGLILAVPLFLGCLLIIFITGYIQSEQEDFEEYVLAYQVDYATDAATMELLEGAHLGLDYQDWGRVKVDPEDAKSVFETCMLLNMDYPLTDKAREELNVSYMPLFCVCAYDGYYVYDQHRDNATGDWSLVPTPKIPYSYVPAEDLTKPVNEQRYYNINLGLVNCRKLLDGALTLEQLVDEGIGTSTVMYEINSQVSDDLMYRYQRYEETNQASHVNLGATFYIPQGLTSMSQVNAIEGPSVIALIDNWDKGTIHELSTFSIGGARVEPTKQVAVYTDANGDKWYAYADLLPGYIIIDDLVPGPQQAAAMGYHYDYNIMG